MTPRDPVPADLRAALVAHGITDPAAAVERAAQRLWETLPSPQGTGPGRRLRYRTREVLRAALDLDPTTFG